MKKLVRFAGIATLVTMAVASVGGCTFRHTHTWEWRRTETEHWEICTGKNCGEERNRGGHAEGEDFVCDECAEFKALAFGYTSKGDSAHADFAKEANVWFPQKGKELGFIYEYASDFVNSTLSDFSMMTDETLENYDLIVLLNDRPNDDKPQAAFKKFMDNGGACVAFHSAGFAMWNSEDPDVTESERPFTAPNEWEDWFQNTLLRCGVYGYCPRVGADTAQGAYYWNTWNPTSEPMTIETHDHFVTADIEVDEFISAPCEWYEWHNDLFEDDGTTVLVTMNPTEKEPAGDDNREELAHQIWKDGHHAIAWANNNYKMVYMNWGHNLQSYNKPTGSTRTQSSTFESEVQNQITLSAMFGLTKKN